MKKYSIASVFAFLLAISGSALAAVVHVSGHGVSHDPSIAMQAARADAIAQCTAQGGAPIAEVYSHLSWAARWLATSVWSCDVP
jgi:hypothetical protein